MSVTTAFLHLLWPAVTSAYVNQQFTFLIYFIEALLTNMTWFVENTLTQQRKKHMSMDKHVQWDISEAMFKVQGECMCGVSTILAFWRLFWWGLEDECQVFFKPFWGGGYRRSARQRCSWVEGWKLQREMGQINIRWCHQRTNRVRDGPAAVATSLI